MPCFGGLRFLLSKQRFEMRRHHLRQGTFIGAVISPHDTPFKIDGKQSASRG